MVLREKGSLQLLHLSASSEPSAIARNKIAELQLRVELERVVRLQREMELEQKRKDGLIKETSSILGGK